MRWIAHYPGPEWLIGRAVVLLSLHYPSFLSAASRQARKVLGPTLQCDTLNSYMASAQEIDFSRSRRVVTMRCLAAETPLVSDRSLSPSTLYLGGRAV